MIRRSSSHNQTIQRNNFLSLPVIFECKFDESRIHHNVNGKMWILCFLLVTGLQKKFVSSDCNDQLLGRRSIELVNGRNENSKFPQFEGDYSRAASAGNDHVYFSYAYSKIVKITGVRVDVREVECSSAYTISYSPDGVDFTDYRTDDGNIKVFRCETTESSENVFTYNFHRVPIVAQYMHVIPHRGNDDLYTKMEFYGCDYEAIPYHFNGSSFVEWNLQKAPIESSNDLIKFRFKTFEANGVFLYGRGLQNDHFGLMLHDNRLLLTINLGANRVTRLLAGSLLDDGVWHDVVVNRVDKSITLSVDRVTVTGHVRGDFTTLNLDHVLYIGGVPKKQQDSMLMHNYTGCLEQLFSNWIDLEGVVRKENTLFECPSSNYFPLTFLSRESFIKFVGLDGIDHYEVSFEFRTFEESGMLVFHELSNHGHFKVFLKNGKLWTHLLAESSQLITMQNFEGYFSDGRWHCLDLFLSTNNLTVVVNEKSVVTVRLISVVSGANTFMGGHVRDSEGFMGCMRKISINKRYKQPGHWQPNEEYCCKDEVLFNSCRLVDRCHPNPCEHNGSCRQTSSDFSCDCSNTGYGGAICHTALLPMNCYAYGLRNRISESEDIKIDLDGSGPLDGFPVTCYFNGRGHSVTILHHDNEATTLVDGFQDAGSYAQSITYRANTDQIEALTKQSTKCWQNLRYECFRSKLLNSPSHEDNFNPFSWWVSRYNQRMDFWGGAIEGSRKCECGMLGQCMNRSKWCNCDAGFYEWRSDGGDIVGKDYLPVKQLRFGDTGSLFDDKKGKYTLGPLYCEGNDIFSNVITLRKSDVSIHLRTRNHRNAYDFYFEFRTGQPNGVLVECEGQGDQLIISLENGNAIRFTHEADGVHSAIFGEHSSSLMNDEWHAVYVEVNRKELRLVIDGNESKQNRNWNALLGEVELSSSLSVGGLHDGSSGFVGCMRAFLINGELVDLVSYVRHFPYGLSEGCVGKCRSNPCLNNGSCIEYYNSYACDCRWTSFKGPICADEIGAIFNGHNGVVYKFPSYRLSTISERIRIGFMTTRAQGVLMKLRSSVSEEYMTVSITNSGHIRVVFDFGFERQEIIYSWKHFDRGQFHDLRISRTHSGSALNLQVDDYEPMETKFNVKMSADSQFDDIEYLQIGREKDTDEGFLGCISRVEFNDFYPLKLLFQQNPPDNVRNSGVIHEDFCGIEPVTHRPEPIETKPVSNLRINIRKYTLTGIATWASSILCFVVFVFFIGKYMANRRAFYHTQEQIGAEIASDADNAVIYSKTGHIVLRRREWFI